MLTFLLALGGLLVLLPPAAFGVTMAYRIITDKLRMSDAEWMWWLWGGTLIMNCGLVTLLAVLLRSVLA
jgi:hypothetical protein